MQMATNGNLINHITRSKVTEGCWLVGGAYHSGRRLSPVDKVDGSVDGVDNPGGAIGQLETLTCSHRLLPDEPEDQ